MEENLWELSRTRWRADEDAELLTWGVRWTGDAFVEKILASCSPTKHWNILEIGPGYGRILQSLLEKQVPFARYTGVELSPRRVAKLTRAFPVREVEFIEADVETLDITMRFDLCLSSATFSHLFPDFSRAVKNIRRHLSEKGVLIFDVSGGVFRGFQPDGVTYGRDYQPNTVKELLSATGFAEPHISTVTHGKDAHNQEVTMMFVATHVMPIFI